ncbi:MAG TPA: helix-turn-helix domain-containing protein, partial [Candidatus Aminicenantes bacterium]|nr:helix-turn-helix domain-containing protein [Candidatus Aminicenantes bacterium]
MKTKRVSTVSTKRERRGGAGDAAVRARIVAAARPLFLERGFLRTTADDIAAELGMSKATLYLYFQSKESLFMEILDEATKSFCAYVEDRIDPEATGIEALNAL